MVGGRLLPHASGSKHPGNLIQTRICLRAGKHALVVRQADRPGSSLKAAIQPWIIVRCNARSDKLHFTAGRAADQAALWYWRDIVLAVALRRPTRSMLYL